MNSHVRIHTYEFIWSMNSSNTNIFPPFSRKVISMGTTGHGNKVGDIDSAGDADKAYTLLTADGRNW
jgi:hypothetical protein